MIQENFGQCVREIKQGARPKYPVNINKSMLDSWEQNLMISVYVCNHNLDNDHLDSQ